MPRANYTVRILRVAEEDLTEIVSFIAQDNPRAADRLADKIEGKLAQLATFPELGKVPDEPALAFAGFRFLVTGNYLAFYTVEGKDVLVHRVLHGARDYKWLL